MKIRDLDGNIQTWSLIGYKNGSLNKSSYHLLARELLVKLYPTLEILEEVTIYLRKNQIAYLDYYLPLRKMAIEVQGEQHFRFIPHFHHTLMNFAQSKRRDADKKEWLDLNGISLIEFLYSESVEEWKAKLI